MIGHAHSEVIRTTCGTWVSTSLVNVGLYFMTVVQMDQRMRFVATVAPGMWVGLVQTEITIG